MGGSTSTNAEAANASAVARERHKSHPNTYQNKFPKGRINRAPRYGAIAILFDFDPPSEGGRKSHKTGPGRLVIL